MYVPPHTFRKNRCLIYSGWTFEISLPSSSARTACMIHLIGIRDSLNHPRVRNKEVKFA